MEYFKGKHILIFVLISVILVGCDTEYSKTRIPELPEVNNDFYKKVIESINRTIEKYPNNPEGYFKKAEVLSEIGNHKAARINIEKAIGLDQSKYEYFFFLANNQYIQNEFDKGLGSAKKALQLGEETSDLCYLMANLYLKKNLPDEAIEYNTKAINLTEDAKNYFQRGQIKLAFGDTTASIKNYKKCIQGYQMHTPSYRELTKIYIGLAWYDSAQYWIAQHLNIEPDNLKVWFNKGYIYHRKKMYDSAKYVFRRIIKEDSTAARSMVQMSRIFFDRYRNDSAAYYAGKALGIRSDYFDAMLMVGKIAGRRQYFNQARDKFNEILAMDSTYMPAKEELKNLDRKIAYLRRLEKERKENEEIEILVPKDIN